MRSIVHLLVVLLGVLAAVSAKHNLRDAQKSPATEVAAAPVKKAVHASWTEPLHTIPASNAFSKRHIQQTGKVVGISAYAKEYFGKAVSAEDISVEGNTEKPQNAVIRYAPNGFFVSMYHGAASGCDASQIDVVANRVNFCTNSGGPYSTATTLMVITNKKTDEYNIVMTDSHFADNECSQVISAYAQNYGILGGCAYDPSEGAYFSNNFMRDASELTFNGIGEGIVIRSYRTKGGCTRDLEKDTESIEYRHSGCRVQDDGTSMRYECYDGRPAMVSYTDNACSVSPSYNTAPEDCSSHDMAKFVCVA